MSSTIPDFFRIYLGPTALSMYPKISCLTLGPKRSSMLEFFLLLGLGTPNVSPLLNFTGGSLSCLAAGADNSWTSLCLTASSKPSPMPKLNSVLGSLFLRAFAGNSGRPSLSVVNPNLGCRAFGFRRTYILSSILFCITTYAANFT